MRIFPTRSALRFGLRSLLFAPVFFVGETCTKLTEVPHDALTTATAFHTDAEVLAGVAGVYAQLRAIEWVGYITLEDLTTDVAIVPTRGSDWYDNGQWLDLHRQTWTPKERFSFIEKELTESAALLPASWDASSYGRVTKGTANAILASLELNAGVFNKDCGPADCSAAVNATAYNPCSVTVGGGKTGCQAAIDAANAVINSGKYTLNSNWFKNFSTDNKSSPENIFVIVHTNG